MAKQGREKKPNDGVVVRLGTKPRKVIIKALATVEMSVIWDKKKRPSAVITGIEFGGFVDGEAEK